MKHKMTANIRLFCKACPLVIALVAAFAACSQAPQAREKPNIVIIFLDDAGYGDFQPFAETDYPTPNVQRLAEEGRMFQNFYVPQAICSASRSALMTGCYPGRTKVFGAHGPRKRGLDPKFATLGEVLQGYGYKTAVFGKWHLGDQPETRPPARGFDKSAGLMYSNDMWYLHPENPKYWGQWPLQYWENDSLTIEPVTDNHQKMLTTWATEHAVRFINDNADRPFFLYVPHSMPHVPLYVSKKFDGKSGKGLYADVMMELDWSVGEINKALKANGLEDDTIVIFSSDNGPWTSYGNHAGKSPFREAKATSFDGGIRSPTIIKYPRAIKANTTSTQAMSTLDVLPTLCAVTGAALPDNPVDGKNVWDLIIGKPGAVNPNTYYPISTNRHFDAVISGDGKWKLHLPHNYRTLIEPGLDGLAGKYEQKQIGMSLFDMRADPLETTNVIAQHPEVAEKMQALAAEHAEKFWSDASE